MVNKHSWNIKAFMFFLVLLVVPLLTEAQQDNTQIPVLLSTGLPATETPEEILPTGAVVYLRANNVQVLLKNIDSLVTTFVPEKALPPAIQPFFAKPQPILTLLTTKMFGQPVDASNLSNLIGIALDRPASLAVYPMSPEKGFVLSVPIANPTLITGMVQSILMPETVENGTIGNVSYYRVVPSAPNLPREIYILASEKAVFFCGSSDVAQMLVNSGNVGTINNDPVIVQGVKKYETRELLLVLSPGLLKAQLPLVKEQLAQMPGPVFQQIRQGVQQIPPADRVLIDTRLRLELGIDGLDQLVDYAEAYSAGIYRVLLDKIAALLTNLDGVALAVNFEEKFQNLALTLFSKDIQAENFTRPLALDAIKQALNALPGDKSSVFVSGQASEARASKLFTEVLNAIEAELENKGLPMNAFLALKEYYLAKQPYSGLEAKVPWTLKTLVAASEKTDLTKFNTVWELLKYALERLSAGPFLASLTLMPAVEEGLIEKHFAGEAENITQNEQLYKKMREKLPLGQPFYDVSGRFQQEELGADLKKLVFEKVYTTRRGFFGYQQHELVNRRIMFHQKKAGYGLLYTADADAARLKTLLEAAPQPVPGAVSKLVEQAPAGTNTLSLFRVIQFVAEVLDVLSGTETVIHREMDAFLAKAQPLVEASSGAEEFKAKLLEAKLDLPLLLVSLHRGADGQVYGTLPGGLHYPRPLVMPKVKELFQDFLAAAAEVGGSASFMAVQPGELEISAVQSTEALALLVKTVINNFYNQYLLAPDGMQRLQSELTHPSDFQDLTKDLIFMNPFWEAVMESANLPFLSGVQEAKKTQTLAEMRAIGIALESYQVDFNFYPKYNGTISLQDAGLPQEYYAGAYTDAWGAPFEYISDAEGSEYMVISYGKDRVAGATTGSEFDTDLVYLNGQFVEAYKDAETTLNPALIKAVNANAADFTRTLVTMGADVNVKDAETNESVLLKAAQSGYTESVRALLDNGADIETKDSYGLTALFLAAYEGHTDMVKLLLDYGADLSVKNEYGMTALLWAAWNGYTETLQALLDRGADIEEKDNDDQAALIKAAYQGHTEIVRILVDKGADINVQDHDGDTALLYAASQGYQEIVQLLLDKEADVTTENNAGQTAMLFAAANKYPDIVKLLKGAGAAAVSDEQVETYRQTSTVERLKAIGKALDEFYQANSAYPTTSVADTDLKEIEQLKQYYQGTSEDVWGNAFRYTSDGKSYTLKSYGRDKTAGKGKNKFDVDIIFSDGKIVAPKSLSEQ